MRAWRGFLHDVVDAGGDIALGHAIDVQGNGNLVAGVAQPVDLRQAGVAVTMSPGRRATAPVRRASLSSGSQR